MTNLKPFDLEEALSGKPVRLKNGTKAFVGINTLTLQDLKNSEPYPLIGIYILGDDYFNKTWTIEGKALHTGETSFDIVSMWEEPEVPKVEKVAEQALFNFTDSVLEKALKEGLKVYSDKYPSCTYTVIAKSNYSYILKNIKLGGIREETFNDLERKRISYRLSNSLNLMNEETITVTLPKPFLPKPDEDYWFIGINGKDELTVYEGIHLEKLDKGLNNDGNFFRTREQAQAWLNVLYNATYL